MFDTSHLAAVFSNAGCTLERHKTTGGPRVVCHEFPPPLIEVLQQLLSEMFNLLINHVRNCAGQALNTCAERIEESTLGHLVDLQISALLRIEVSDIVLGGHDVGYLRIVEAKFAKKVHDRLHRRMIREPHCASVLKIAVISTEESVNGAGNVRSSRLPRRRNGGSTYVPRRGVGRQKAPPPESHT